MKKYVFLVCFVLIAGCAHVSGNSSESGNEANDDIEKILNSMGHEPISIDTLIERSGLGVEIVSSIL